eukprot:CAMPEP_0172484800 /NCGR_PEP_ID=MMETSP1066-20121228/12406_1 /TAXON_ID=671091 /ORGANISM="Coscinodiscus wailesii, Strain CCMP2513" /LENGTH=670 /DNA_ID=CAMNT_0013249553 /DNA_START=242 /DNA_END=2251 /DNA_ORIENTATION=+
MTDLTESVNIDYEHYEDNDSVTDRRDIVERPGKGFIKCIYHRLLNHIKNDSILNRRHAVTQKDASRASSSLSSSSPLPDLTPPLPPIFSYLPKYDLGGFRSDLLAGLTVAVMLIPQSMSYAAIAGLPVQYGLYSSFLPLYAYALFGTSPHLAVGPVALVSLLLNTRCRMMLGDKDDDGGEEYEEVYQKLATQIAFLVGVLLIVLGVLRLGFLTIFLSHAVVSGFSTGAAMIIALSQLKHVLGYSIAKSDNVIDTIASVVSGASDFQLRPFLVGASNIFVLESFKYLSGRDDGRYGWLRPMGPLVVCALSVSITWIFGLEDRGVPIVGEIPKGLPSFDIGNLWPPVSADVELSEMLYTVVGIAIIGFTESIAIAKQLANKHKYELDSSLELVGLGMANFVGAMFHSYPITGSFSRSAVNNAAGAKTGMSGVITATIVGVVLVAFTFVFEHMPMATLAAIVISGVCTVLDFKEAAYLYRVHKLDFAVWVIAFSGTLFLKVEVGLAIAVVISLSLVLYESAYPATAELGRLPGTSQYRNVTQYPDAERYPGILCVKVDAPYYFANMPHVREEITKYEVTGDNCEGNRAIQFVILDLSPVSHMDSSALHILEDMHRNYMDRGVRLCLANPNCKVLDIFFRSGLLKQIGDGYFFVTLHDAVNWCLHHMVSKDDTK